jgi:hypothetical protein
MGMTNNKAEQQFTVNLHSTFRSWSGSPLAIHFSAAWVQRRKSGLDCLSAASFQAARSAPLAALETCVAGDPDHDLNALGAHWTQMNAVYRESLKAESEVDRKGAGGLHSLD